MAAANDKGRVKSVEQGLVLIKALARSGGALSLKDLSAAVAMPPSKAHRYLVSLIASGMVEQVQPTGHYRLGAESLYIGLAAMSQLELVRQAEVPMQKICQDLNETALLSVWGNNGPTIIKMLEPAKPVTVNVRVGFSLPLLSSATGLIFAVCLPEAQTKEMLRAELKLYQNGDRASVPRNIKQARALTEEVRKRGLSRVEGALLAGINSFGAPLFDHKGSLAGVLTILGSADEVELDWRGPVALALKQTAVEISRRMGHQPFDH